MWTAWTAAWASFNLTYEMNVYPVRIDYLPHSRLVLWISCGEES